MCRTALNARPLEGSPHYLSWASRAVKPTQPRGAQVNRRFPSTQRRAAPHRAETMRRRCSTGFQPVSAMDTPYRPHFSSAGRALQSYRKHLPAPHRPHLSSPVPNGTRRPSLHTPCAGIYSASIPAGRICSSRQEDLWQTRAIGVYRFRSPSTSSSPCISSAASSRSGVFLMHHEGGPVSTIRRRSILSVAILVALAALACLPSTQPPPSPISTTQPDPTPIPKTIPNKR